LLAPQSAQSVIADSYIVVLKDDVTTEAILAHSQFVQGAASTDPFQGDDSGLKHIYDGSIKGYAGKFTEQTLERIRTQPEVAYVEKDQLVWTQETQKNAPWGLARISHRERLGFGTFTKYEYAASGGEGVDVYVIDTGINTEHVEFEGRASWGKTMPKNDVDEDGNGHGTHCAGTIASRRYGVAKGANVIAVKVLGSNGSGTMSDVVGGVLFASEQSNKKAAAAAAEFAATGQTSHKGSVASMSLGGGKSRALDDAVNRAVSNGLHFAVAAGNDNKDACDYSPAGAEKAITVGASTIGDERAYFSNHGSCVDVFGPGLNILSTWTGGKTATNTISGTSMATPHVAGLMAYYLSLYPSLVFNPTLEPTLAPPTFLESAMSSANPSLGTILNVAHAILPNWAAAYLPSSAGAPKALVAPVPHKPITPAQLKQAILDLATKDVLTSLPPKTANKLIYNNATALSSYVIEAGFW